MGKLKDLRGQKFGRLIVLNIPHITKNKRTYWYCQCDCGNQNIKLIAKNHLCSGETISCGCLQKEMTSKVNKIIKKKFNTYILSQDYCMGYTLKGEIFYFDLEDYNKIKDICWYKSDDGYIINKTKDKIILMHRLILDCKQNETTDHKNRIRYDNRKINLRKCNLNENARNISLPCNNSSGIIGVSWYEQNNQWLAKICVDYLQINLGYFIKFDDAVRARLNAEKEYFNDYSPQKHLFKEYGIN